MTERSPDTAAALRVLTAEVRAIRAHQAAHAHMRHGWLRFIVKDLETNPRTQYKVHLYGVVYWLVNFPVIAAFFFLFPAAWLKWGVFITLVYSIYANFATDYGSMSASMAAFDQHVPEIPLETHSGAG